MKGVLAVSFETEHATTSEFDGLAVSGDNGMTEEPVAVFGPQTGRFSDVTGLKSGTSSAGVSRSRVNDGFLNAGAIMEAIEHAPRKATATTMRRLLLFAFFRPCLILSLDRLIKEQMNARAARTAEQAVSLSITHLSASSCRGDASNQSSTTIGWKMFHMANISKNPVGIERKNSFIAKNGVAVSISRSSI